MVRPTKIEIAYATDDQITADAWWFIFSERRLLVQFADVGMEPVRLSKAETPPVPIVRKQMIGYLDGVPCFSAESPPGTDAPPETIFASLRKLYSQMDESAFWMAARAVQLVDWDRTHQFCGQCGSGMIDGGREHVKICPTCAHRAYPRLAPAIIVAITDGDKILLANNVRYRNRDMYSVLAGFVEPGETLEQTVAREVKEEAGIDVKNIRYFGSQPWPFPHSLMIGFTAEYAGGDLVLEDAELRAADWFTADNLPVIPTPPSIAYNLIAAFVAAQEN